MYKIGFLALALTFGALSCASKQKGEDTAPNPEQVTPKDGDPDGGGDQQTPDGEEDAPVDDPEAPEAKVDEEAPAKKVTE